MTTTFAAMRSSAIVLLLLLSGCDQPTSADSTAANAATTLAELPWQRGYYVASDVDCAAASNATLLLAQRDGLSGARDFCEFQDIVVIGGGLYRVTETCGAFQDDYREDRIVTYELQSTGAFTTRDEWGNESSYRYCQQASLPVEWRDNDISDITE